MAGSAINYIFLTMKKKKKTTGKPSKSLKALEQLIIKYKTGNH